MVRKPDVRRFLSPEAESLLEVAKRTRDPRLTLSALRLHRLSKQRFGWATPHQPRWWEYPWVKRHVLARRSVAPKTVADFGAGKSPIILALADAGFEAHAIDPYSPLGDRFKNEWEWTDYSKWGVTTHRAGIEDRVFEGSSLGFAISVSAIEHIPAAHRRRGLHNIANALVGGGFAVFTVDVLAGSVTLWNKTDVEIESFEVHGTVDDLIAEARTAGMALCLRERCPIRERTGKLDVEGLLFQKVDA